MFASGARLFEVKSLKWNDSLQWQKGALVPGFNTGNGGGGKRLDRCASGVMPARVAVELRHQACVKSLTADQSGSIETASWVVGWSQQVCLVLM